MEKKIGKNRANSRKFVRYKEGAALYSMCQSKFEDMAKDAGAIYKVNKLVLVNTEIFEKNPQNNKKCGCFSETNIDGWLCS